MDQPAVAAHGAAPSDVSVMASISRLGVAVARLEASQAERDAAIAQTLGDLAARVAALEAGFVRAFGGVEPMGEWVGRADEGAFKARFDDLDVRLERLVRAIVGDAAGPDPDA